MNKETGEGSMLVENDLLDMTCLIKEQKAADMKDIANHAQHAIAVEKVGETGRMILSRRSARSLKDVGTVCHRLDYPIRLGRPTAQA